MKTFGRFNWILIGRNLWCGRFLWRERSKSWRFMEFL